MTDAERDFGVCWLDGPFSRSEGWVGIMGKERGVLRGR